MFVDTNVWIASFVAHGLCADLVRAALAQQDAGNIRLQVCPSVLDEICRLLREKFGASQEQVRIARELFDLMEIVPDCTVNLPPDFPDPDDITIVGAAIAAKAEVFVTGDKALLSLGRIGRLELLDPRSAYQRLLGLV